MSMRPLCGKCIIFSLSVSKDSFFFSRIFHQQRSAADVPIREASRFGVTRDEACAILKYFSPRSAKSIVSSRVRRLADSSGIETKKVRARPEIRNQARSLPILRISLVSNRSAVHRVSEFLAIRFVTNESG